MSHGIAVKEFDPKRVDEDIKVSWDFANLLATGEAISGTPTVTATVFDGTDTSPSSIVSGAATVSGSVVTQLIIDGLNGVTYLLECEADTDDSQKLHGMGLLLVTNDVRVFG